MAKEILEIEITASNKSAVASLQNTSKQLEDIAKKSSITSDKLSQLAKGTNQANNALTNLGRVAQDAPFGFIGIQNNLNPLLESFQRLKAETGSTGTALKALGSSLMGAGGLGFALSAASALFLVFGDAIMGAGKKSEEAKKTLDEVTNNVVKDAAQVRLLVEAYKDSNTTQAERVQIIKELQRIAPEQFANLDAEKTSYEQLTKAIDAYNGSIGNKIRAELKLKDLENLIKEEQELRKLVKLQEDYNMRMKTGRTYTTAGEKLTKNLQEQLKLEKEINSYKKPFKVPKPEKIDYGPAIRNYRYTPPKSKYKEQRTQSSSTGMPEAPQQISGENQIQGILDSARQLQAQKGAISAYNEQMQQAAQITNVAAQAFTDLGQALLQGQSLGDALGNMFKKLAADIIAAAAKAFIFKTVLSFFPGFGKVAEGAGQSIPGFGKLFKGFLGFASGGTVSGPKSGYPVMLHGTEHIVRPDQMNKIVGGAAQMGQMMANQGQTVNVVGKISGMDIWLSKQRTDYFRGLTT